MQLITTAVFAVGKILRIRIERRDNLLSGLQSAGVRAIRGRGKYNFMERQALIDRLIRGTLDVR